MALSVGEEWFAVLVQTKRAYADGRLEAALDLTEALEALLNQDHRRLAPEVWVVNDEVLTDGVLAREFDSRPIDHALMSCLQPYGTT